MKPFTHRNVVGPKIVLLRRERGWTQAALALHLQHAGWKISRNGVAKIEEQLGHVDDQGLCYLRQVLRVEVRELFPAINLHKTIREVIEELLSKEPVADLAAA